MKRDLKDTTFIIPIFIDSPERLENVKCILKFLQDNFDTNFSICEYVDVNRNFNWNIGDLVEGAAQTHVLSENVNFNRTEAINKAIKHKAVKTPYIAIYDTDVIFDPENIYKAVKFLHAGYTMAYPYSGVFSDIDRSYIETGIIKEVSQSYVSGSYGGACFLNREHYLKCGLENENLRGGHVPDDIERVTRLKNLGFKVERVSGICYHIQHPPAPDQGNNNKYKEENQAEFIKVRDMSRVELEEYIETWAWAKK